MGRIVVSVVVLGVMLGCGKGETDTVGAGRTDREPDSVISQSKVPNAAAVGAAMKIADSGQTRVARQDSVSNAPE
jgi:hypothetical protein